MVLGSAIVSGNGVISDLAGFFFILRRSSLVMVIGEVSSSVVVSGVVLGSLVFF